MRELRLMRYDNYIEGGSPGRHEVGHQEGIGGSPGRHYTVLPKGNTHALRITLAFHAASRESRTRLEARVRHEAIR